MADETLSTLLPADGITAPTAPTDTVTGSSDEPTESFGEAFAEYERTHRRAPVAEGDAKQLQGTVVSIDAEYVYLDVGFKTEGVLLLASLPKQGDGIAVGDVFPVSIKGRTGEGLLELSRIHVVQPTDWSALERAFEAKTPITGLVTGIVKGGLTVDVGVRAFMPASRSGTREAGEMEKLVGTQIECMILKLDTDEEDVVVDRREIVEQQARAEAQARFGEITEGMIVSGTVRSLTTYGAFLDLGGLDGLLHISDMSWSRVNAPEDVLSVGDALQLKVLKVDSDGQRVSLGLKQMEPEPWETAATRYKEGERITGTVRRLTDFGAFVELEPGIEGLIHVSEMSWVKKVRKPEDLLKVGDSVEAIILSVDAGAKRISLGLKQALGDPWMAVPEKFGVGSAVEGTVTRLATFGAFVQVAEGVEGLVHISEMVADKRINHPSEVVRVGEVVKAQVLALDPEKRQMRLSMKQLVPTGLDEYLEEHKVGDVVSGRIVAVTASGATVELGEGIRVLCDTTAKAAAAEAPASSGAVDLSSFSSMLSNKWKTGGSSASAQPAAVTAGQVRSFRIVTLDREAKQLAVELA